MEPKEEFVSLLQSTGRQGMERVITYLEQVGFFSAPASVRRHLNYDGGLLEHSLNVYRVAMRLRADAIAMRPELEERLPQHSIIIAALLHDVCKANIYRRIKKWRKDDENNRWEQYDTYDTDYSRLPVGHGEKSVIMLLSLGLKLEVDEIVAIRWHMGAWELAMQSFEAKENISQASGSYPLASIIQSADALATHLLENSFN